MVEPDGLEQHGKFFLYGGQGLHLPARNTGVRRVFTCFPAGRDHSESTMNAKDPQANNASSAGVEKYLRATERGRRSLSPLPSDIPVANTLSIPKNRSTGNLLAHAAGADISGRLPFSIDGGLAAADYDTMSRWVENSIVPV